MKLPFLLTHPALQRLIYSATSLLMGLAFVLSSYSVLGQATYSTAGLYTYTVPAGGPFQIRVTARGGDGGGENPTRGGSGASVGETFTLQSGDVLTLIVGQSGGSVPFFGIENGGGGGGSAVVLTRNGTRTLLVAAGGGGGATNLYPREVANPGGGGGQGLGSNTGGAGGPTSDFLSGSGGGGGLTGPGGNGSAAADNGFGGGSGGGAASLTAVSPGGIFRDLASGYGGRGFGGGGGVGGYDRNSTYAYGGGGGGYGGGNGSGSASPTATGGYSYVSPTGSATTVSPGSNGGGTNVDGLVTIAYPNTTASFSTANQSICPGLSTTLQGTVSAIGSWTIVLSDGTVSTGSGSNFSIPVSPVTSTTYTIASLTDQTLVKATNLTSKVIVTVSLPTVSLTNNGPLSCTQPNVTLTASGGNSYTFTNGTTLLPGDPTSNIRVVTSPGNYSVIGSLNGCTRSATTTVTSFAIVVVNPATTFFVVDQAVSQAFTASEGVPGSPDPPYSFSVASGSLPPGLSLSANGQLTGSPTQTGSFTAIIQAKNANGCLGLGVPYEVNVTQPPVTGPVATYTTPGLYTYTVPAGGPYRVWLTARGGDGGAESLGGTGARVEGSYFVQSGDLLTVIVGQSGRLFSRGGGGGGGGSAIVLTHNGAQTLLVAAGGGGGGGQRNITPGGGGRGLGPSTGGVGGRSTYNYSGGGGGGGLDGPGGNGGSGFDPGGTGGGVAILTAPSSGGPYGSGTDGSGGSGFGGGGGVGGGDSLPGRLVGGGGGGYGGGDGGDNGAPVDGATGGYSYVSPAGSNTSVTPGIGGASRNREGIATIGFGQNTATAAITTTNLAVCQGVPSNIEGTVSATGNWTLVLTNGLTTTGSGTSFSIPVSPASPTTYTIESLLDDQGFAPVSNLSGQASVTAIKPLPTVSLTNNGPLTCTQPSVTLTASGATAYTFTTGNLPLAGDPASNIRVVTSPGTYSVVGVSPNGCTNSATTTVTSVATVTVVNPATALFVVGQAVSQAFTASGGASPRSFSVASGSLPPGLSLSGDGQLSGSPTQTGSFTAIIQATDANGCPGLGAPYEVNITQPIDMSLTATYTTPGLYTYTVPAGGPYRVWLTARGGDGGYYSIGGTGARVEGSYTVESGDLLTVMVGQRGKYGSGNDGNGTGGGGGGGSAVVLTHNGTQTLLVAAGGGGGGGRRYITPGGGGQGLGPSTGGAGGQNGISADGNYSGGGGGGGLDGPGGNGTSGYFPGGTGGGAASLTALSAGGRYNNSTTDGFGGSGFGGGGALGGRDTSPSRPVGGGGGGYGGGHGGDSVFPSNGGATGGYSYVSPAGSNTSVTPGIRGISRDRDGIATIDFSQNTATAAITTTSLVVCDGSSVNIEGTINAKGNWTIMLSNGVVGTGSGSTFSIPVSTLNIVSGYPYLTIESLLDDQGFAPVSNLSGQAIITVNPRPRTSLTNNGPLSCTQPSVTLTASEATSYTFTIGGVPLAGDPASNTRVVTSPGTYLVVGDLNGCTRSATTTVTSLGIIVANPATTSFVVNQAVSQAFTASGGAGPRSFSVASGSLPPGLSLSADGQLSGSPTQTGSFTTVIQATDTNGCTGVGTPYVINVTSFSITNQPPASLLVCADNPVSVSVGVSGIPTAYQWYKDNAPVSGQTSATLSLPSASPSDAGSYVVVITGGEQSLTSTAFSLTVGPRVPARFYVNASATGGNTGLDWANAFTDLQSALNAGNACANNLREIWVAGGVYKPTATADRFVSFRMLSGVALYGGFVGNETALSQRPSVNPNLGGASKPSSSTLSGDIGQPGNDLDNSLVVIGGADLVPTTVLDGFVITGGRAEASDVPIGGGLTNVANSGNSSPTLTNLFFINNYSANIGGAILNYGAGGAASPTISDCRFEQNTASSGGAIATVLSGGNSRPVITNCFFGGNSATQWGGAIANVSFGGTLSPAITNCAFQNNSATQGGALWQVTIQASVLNALITNCSFGGNRAGEGGTFYNTTSFPGSPAGGSIGLTLVNSVLFDNGGASTFSNTGQVTLSARYSLLEPSVTGYTDGGNNRTTASSPFVSPTSLLLGGGSPAINAGDNPAYQTAGGPATDLDGNVRIQQTTIDLGAYESGDQTPCPPLAFTAPLASGSAVCVGGSVQVTGSLSGTPTSYQWYKDGTPLTTQTSATLTLSNLQTTDAGAYSLVVTDGCNPAAPTSLTSTAFSLTVSAAPVATILVPNGSALSCAQPVLSLTAIGGDTYRWEDNSTSAVRSVSVAGTYSVTTTTSPGCSATATTTIASTTALITLTNPGQTTATLGAPFSQTFTAAGGTGPYSFSLASSSLPPGLSLSGEGVLSGTPTQSGSFSLSVQARDAGGCTAVSGTAYTLLVRDAVPIPTLTLTNVSVSPASVCVGGSTTVTATVGNATGSYAYTLTNGTSTTTGTGTNSAFSQPLIASGSGLQTFTLTVSSAGQSASATTTLTVNPLPIPTLSASNGGLLTCGQTSLTLTAGGGDTYAFSGPGIVSQSGNTATVTAAGVYSVTATSTSGCFSTTTTTVTSTTDSPSVSISASATALTCASPTLSLTAVGAGTVLWNTGSTEPVITVIASGTYSVTLTAPGGCSATATTNIASTTALITLTNPGQTTATLGAPFSQTFTAAGGISPYSFSLVSGSLPPGLSLSGEGVLSGTPTQSGSFSLSVQARDAGGCTAVSGTAYTLLVRDAVPIPTLTLTNVSVSPASVCVGGSTTVTATVGDVTGSYAYTLTNGSSTTTGSSDNPAFSQPLIASGSGLQTFTLTVSSAGQSASATTTLTVNPLPIPTLVASNGGLLSCTQTSLTLTAGGGDTYAFSGPGVLSQSGNTATVTAAGVYSVTATSTSGCFSTTTTTVTSTTDSPAVSISASATALTCASPSVSLTATGTGEVRWNTGETTPVLSVSAAGTYSVTLTSGSSCSATASVTLQEDLAPPTNAQLSSGTLSCSQTSLTLTASATGGQTGATLAYRFSGGTPLVEGQTPVGVGQVVVTTTGLYSVTITGANGCTTVAQTTVSGSVEEPLAFVQPPASASSVAPGTTVTTTVSVTGSGPLTYQWYKDNLSNPVPNQTSATLTLPNVQLADAGSYSVVVRGSCGIGTPTSLTSTAFALSITAPNTAPTLANAISSQTATVGQSYSISLAGTFTDQETPNSLTLSASGLPAGLSLVGTTLSGTPSVSGVSTVTLTATDPGSLSASTSFGLTVSPASSVTVTAPFAITSVTTISCTPVGDRINLSFAPQYTGTTGQPIRFSVVNELLPTTEPGPYTLSLYADNPTLTLSATQSGSPTEARFVYNWLAACQTSTGPNTPPRLVTPLSSQTATAGQGFAYVLPAGTFTDSETPLTLTLSAQGVPPGLRFEGTTLSGTPSTTVGSPYSVSFTATDPGGLSVTTELVLLVIPATTTPPPTPPFAITGVTTLSCTPVGDRINLSFAPHYAGLNGAAVSFEVVNELAATSNPAPYSLSLYRDNPTLQLRATQSGSVGEASFVYNWLAACQTLGQDNTPPRINSAVDNQTATLGQGYSLNLTNTFADQETPNGVTLSVSGLPAGLSLAGSTISGTPSVSGVSTVTLTATDPGSLSTSTSFVLTVSPARVEPPTTAAFSITGVTTLSCEVVRADLRRVTFTPQYTGVSGEPISFSVVNEQLPTTEPGPYTLNLYTDNPTITLSARQGGTVSSYGYNWLAGCQPSARLGVGESRMQVNLLGNPVTGEQVQVAIRGVAGQEIELTLIDQQGKQVHRLRIEQAGLVETVSLPVGRSRGVLVLGVASGKQQQRLKVLVP